MHDGWFTRGINISRQNRWKLGRQTPDTIRNPYWPRMHVIRTVTWNMKSAVTEFYGGLLCAVGNSDSWFILHVRVYYSRVEITKHWIRNCSRLLPRDKSTSDLCLAWRKIWNDSLNMVKLNKDDVKELCLFFILFTVFLLTHVVLTGIAQGLYEYAGFGSSWNILPQSLHVAP